MLGKQFWQFGLKRKCLFGEGYNGRGISYYIWKTLKRLRLEAKWCYIFQDIRALWIFQKSLLLLFKAQVHSINEMLLSCAVYT